jgi:hypothetical protein
MAVVILCGLVTSTALNMLVVPALYLRFGSVRRTLAKAGAEPAPGVAATAAARCLPENLR